MTKGLNDLEFEKFKESTTVAGKKGIIVVNPDGSNVGGSVSVDTTGLATDSNQTDGSQKTQIVDGAGNVIGATSNALDVNIKSGSSSGVQYTEGDTDATITGTAIMFETNTGTNALGVVNASNPLPVSVTGGGDASAANQTTIIGHVDGIETLLGTIDADTSNLSTKIDTIAGAVAGTEVQVDVLTMPTTTVQATNLDIRDLTNASDSVAIYGSDDGGTTKRIIKTDSGGAIQVDLEVTSVTANAGTNLNTSALALEAGGNLAAIKAKTDNIPAQGQALAAASLPVVLPADQITTLTPPAAITGFATSAKQDTIIGHVDGIETLIGTSNSSLSTIAGKDFATQTTLAAMNAKMVSGTDIGDVTINNASGASAVNIQDGGNTITVDGTITANLSATDNQVLDDISADTGNIDTKLGTIDTDTGNIATSLGNIDNAVDGNYLNVNMNLAGTDAQAGEGTISANTQRVTIATDDDSVTLLKGVAGFVPSGYDYIALTYTDTDLTGVVYKTGGSGGTTVATLTLAYTAHVLDSITKS